MKYLLVILTLLPLLAHSGNSCNKENVYLYKSIECCISDRLTRSICQKKVDQLDDKLLGAISKVRTDILKKNYEKQNIPNCFWLSLAFFDKSTLKHPQLITESQFLNEIKNNFKEISDSKIEPFDLIYYNGHFEMTHDILNDGLPIPLTSPFHAGIYLSEDLILQKENSSDEIFSLVELKDSFLGYDNAFADMKNGHLELKVLRSNW